MRVYTVPGKKELGRFSLELATRAIDWYNEWFGLVYPLPKCDLIGIPDFSMGGTFQKSFFLQFIYFLIIRSLWLDKFMQLLRFLFSNANKYEWLKRCSDFDKCVMCRRKNSEIYLFWTISTKCLIIIFCLLSY